MKVKVQCACGSRFEFEVEPVDGKMPGSIQCPTCGADATEPANLVIKEQSRAGSPRLGLRVTDEPKVTATEEKSAGPDSASLALGEAGGTQCPKHRSQPATDTCRVCGKPICIHCMELFGYLCSVYCRNQALERRLQIPVCPYEKSVLADRENRAIIRGSAALAVLAVLVVGAWIWYAWFASVPKMVYSLPLAESSRNNASYELAGSGRLVSLAGNTLSLHDLVQKKVRWSASLDLPESAAARFFIRGADVWVMTPQAALRLDLGTGERKQEITLSATAGGFSHDDEFILATPSRNSSQKTLTQINLSTGAARTERAGLTSTPAGTGDNRALPVVGPPTDRYVWTGANAAGIKTRLLEAHVVMVPTMRPKSDSVLNSSSLNASQGLDLAMEMASDAQRERNGGVRAEDLSRYQVTLHRWFGSEAPEWTSEVTGPPRFFPLKTVDVLVAGALAQVFDKNNKKLWETKLTYGLRDHAGEEGDPLPPPCLEHGGRLYLADKGMLTAFEAATGRALWRLPSVGISRIQLDEAGMLYVDSTTGGPDLIQYPQDLELRSQAQTVVLKLEPATGRVLWSFPQLGEHTLLAGKFAYIMKTSLALALLHPGEGEKYNFNFYRVNPASAGTIWSYYQPKPLVKAGAQGTWILLQFPDELQVFSFFSL